MPNLLIVESPSKAKTLNKYLGKDFNVIASQGHIKDLPSGDLGVDIEKDFKPFYFVIKGKGKIIQKMKELARKSDKIFLGPDPDREGEAIA
ncbi:MAG: toprim domain-containing protein, partial [Deltaproteobacteria bacterium]|nr:toprim domain-containing protein [Deltaproteobacteria bacterium]